MTNTTTTTEDIQTITLGAGCFWCLEAALNMLNGVKSAISGYMGGEVPEPTYDIVCSGSSGHVEVVQVTFDNNIISVEQVLLIFFSMHNPTQLNRQGNDIGTQYRSVVFYHSEFQKNLTEEMITDLEAQKIWPDKIVTAVEPVSRFYPAEDYHQGYAMNNTNNPYCAYVVNPKLEKFKQQFKDIIKVS